MRWLDGMWEGAWNSGQWNAVNQGRKRVGGEARGDKMWRVEKQLRKAQPCGWGQPPWRQREQRPKDQQVKNFLTALQSCQTWVGRGQL